MRRTYNWKWGTINYRKTTVIRGGFISEFYHTIWVWLIGSHLARSGLTLGAMRERFFSARVVVDASACPTPTSFTFCLFDGLIGRTPAWYSTLDGRANAWLPWERARGVDLVALAITHDWLLDGSSTCEKLAARAPRTPWARSAGRADRSACSLKRVAVWMGQPDRTGPDRCASVLDRCDSGRARIIPQVRNF